MGGRSLIKLLKKINANRKLLYDLSKIIHVPYKNIEEIFNKNKKTSDILSLPDEFISFMSYRGTQSYKDAINYIKNRGITDLEIMRYNIGYCDKGKYINRIIVPSYDVNGIVNYFVARSYKENWHPKYKNPPAPNNEYVIFFDIFINWDLPIVLVEGVFDAISAKRNAIPLLGQSITSALRQKLIQRDVNNVVIALDADAIKTSFKYVESFLSEGINVKFMNLYKKDPADMKLSEFVDLYNKSSNFDFENLFKMKMEL